MKHIKNAARVFVTTFIVVAIGGALAPALLPAGFTATAYATGVAAVSALGTLVGGLLTKGASASSDNFNQGSKISNRSAQAPRPVSYTHLTLPTKA